MPKYLLTISEHGKEVLNYSDNDKRTFLERSKKLIADHMDFRSHPSGPNSSDLKNIQIHIFQVE